MKFLPINFGNALVSAATLLLASGCFCYAKPKFKDQNVEVIRKGFVSYLSVHSSNDEAVLKIFGSSFRPVRGQAPYYLTLPDTNLLLFVSGRTCDGGHATVHIANLSMRKIQNFSAHDSHIGENIGSTESGRFERVRSFDGRHLVVEARFSRNSFIYFIDLKKGEFEKEIAAYLYSPTKTTNVYEYTHGFSTRRGESVAKALPTYDLESLPR